MAGLWLIGAVIALGAVLRLPGRIILLMVSCLWAGIALLLALAPGSAAAQSLGGNARHWLLGGGAAALILGYRALLGHLRRSARPAVTRDGNAPRNDALTGPELDRYARHLVLREIGGPGQMRLRGARVLVIGAGGLGAPVCLYLAAAGIGQITIADDDRVSLSNLQRQVIFRDHQRGEPKAAAAASAMGALNPHIKVTALPRRVGAEDKTLIAQHDLVIDGSDSFASRAAINAACVAAGVPLISGAIAQWEGQIALYDPARGGPCMACLFPEAPAPGLAPDCAGAGVVGALPGVVGAMMALEAIKHLAGAGGQDLRGRMLIFDGLWGENRVITTARRKDCAICQRKTT